MNDVHGNMHQQTWRAILLHNDKVQMRCHWSQFGVASRLFRDVWQGFVGAAQRLPELRPCTAASEDRWHALEHAMADQTPHTAARRQGAAGVGQQRRVSQQHGSQSPQGLCSAVHKAALGHSNLKDWLRFGTPPSRACTEACNKRPAAQGQGVELGFSPSVGCQTISAWPMAPCGPCTTGAMCCTCPPPIGCTTKRCIADCHSNARPWEVSQRERGGWCPHLSASVVNQWPALQRLDACTPSRERAIGG